MFSKRFEKETFKETVKDNVRALYRKTIDEATPQQLLPRQETLQPSRQRQNPPRNSNFCAASDVRIARGSCRAKSETAPLFFQIDVKSNIRFGKLGCGVRRYSA